MLSDYRLSRMRPCVRKLLEGVRDEKLLARKGARHFLIVELKRLDFSLEETQAVLTDWNERNIKPVPPARLKSQLLSYATWLYGRDVTKLSCNRIQELGCCLSTEGKCDFRETLRRENNKARLSNGRMEMFTKMGWPAFLENNAMYGDATLQVYQELSSIQAERDLPPDAPIYVGFREIASKVKRKYSRAFSEMQACRCVNELQSLGLLKIASRGSWGSMSRKANGYVLLDPPRPSLGTENEKHNDTY